MAKTTRAANGGIRPPLHSMRFVAAWLTYIGIVRRHGTILQNHDMFAFDRSSNGTNQNKASGMKRKLDIKSVALGVLLGAVIVFSVGAATGGNRTVWEYKIVRGNIRGNDASDELDKYINNTIAGGWDFVSASPLGDLSGFAVLRREKK